MTRPPPRQRTERQRRTRISRRRRPCRRIRSRNRRRHLSSRQVCRNPTVNLQKPDRKGGCNIKRPLSAMLEGLLFWECADLSALSKRGDESPHSQKGQWGVGLDWKSKRLDSSL